MRRKLSISLLAIVMATVGAVVVNGEPAFANSPGPIQNHGSGLCLQPLPDNFQTIFDNNVRIAQVACNNTLEQQWLPVLLGTGHDPLFCTGFGCPATSPEPFYYLINQRSNLCLDVKDASTADRADIQQFACNGGGSEKWFKHPYQFGRTQYVNSRTAKCLDIPNATAGPTYIWQYHCTSANVAQAFSFPA